MYTREDSALAELTFFDTEPEAVRAAGPKIGPIHSGVIPPPPELRRGVPTGAVLSPLAITLDGLRPGKARKRVTHVVVHTTGSKQAIDSKKSGWKKPAVSFALAIYRNPNIVGFPHYVIDFNGTIYAVTDERHVASHAGWGKGGDAVFKAASWRSPAWWLSVWGSRGFRSPLDLLPSGVTGPNTESIGIELLNTTTQQYTDEQYRALARLIVDIEKRHGLAISSAPSPKLLGHEDFSPHTRADGNGGWDPGAHRKNPRFSWGKLWSYMRGSASTPTSTSTVTSTGTVTNAPGTPPANPQAYRKFRLTHYIVFDQRHLPTGEVRVPILGDNGSRLAEGSPAFFAQLSLQGTGRLVDGRLLNVTGKIVPVSHTDYEPVLAHVNAINKRRSTKGIKPLSYRTLGITVTGGRVTGALAFHEIPAAKRGIGYGIQRKIPLVPFRTLAADLGAYKTSEQAFYKKGGLVPAGTRVYIHEFKGMLLPDGTTHDGWFVVNDTGGAIFGAHFDVFAGTRELAKKVKIPSLGTVWFSGIEQRIPPGYSKGL
jgi:N-acetyl-anhydromuramyl-L-alanine amidase AmpD